MRSVRDVEPRIDGGEDESEVVAVHGDLNRGPVSVVSLDDRGGSAGTCLCRRPSVGFWKCASGRRGTRRISVPRERRGGAATRKGEEEEERRVD